MTAGFLALYAAFGEKRAHRPGENHKWDATWNRVWMCGVCGCIMNRMTGEIVKKGERK